MLSKTTMTAFKSLCEAYRDLCQMPAGEMAFRIWLRMKQAAGRALAGAHATGAGEGSLSHDQPMQFFINPANRGPATDLLREHYGIHSLIREADEVCSHRFRLFRSQVKSFGERINWHFASGRLDEYPRMYFDRISISDVGQFGDVKYTWELNRHQHFCVLGRAYWASDDKKYAREFVRQLQGWIADNPFLIGVNWTNTLEVAMRGIAWLWAYHFFASSPEFRVVRGEMLDALLLHVHYIDRFMTMGHAPSNHIIGEAAGLLHLGLFFSRNRLRKKWVDKAIYLLEREMQRQVYRDGSSKEQSPSYHRLVLDFFTLSYLICKMNGRTLSRAFCERLEKMYEYQGAVLKGDGRAYSFGDSDDARLLRLSSRPVDDYRGMLSSGAAIFESPALKALSDGFDEESFWLLGRAGHEAFLTVPDRQVESSSAAYPDSGLFLLRPDEPRAHLELRFDCGPQGLPPTHAHGHADALSIEVTARGRNALVDAGTYAYNIVWAWRSFFRSTFAHNVVVVDGKGQAVPRRTFRWGQVPKVRCLRWGFGHAYDYVEGEHDGYQRLPGPVRHRRIVLFVKPTAFYVIDLLEAGQEHDYELFLHFAPGNLEVHPDGSACWQGREGGVLDVRLLSPCSARIAVVEGSLNPVQGWVSRGYGEKEPAPTLTLKACRIGRTVLGLRLAARDVEEARAQVVAVEGPGHLWVSRLRMEGGEEELILSPPGRKWALEDLESDAELTFLRRRNSGEIVSGLSVGGSFLKFPGGTLDFPQRDQPTELVVREGQLQAWMMHMG